MYYIYMLRCKDNSIYTGIAKDLQKRMREHFTKDKSCAKYTLNHGAMKLETAWITQNKSLALKLEYHIKTLSKIKKEELILNNNISELLYPKIDENMYKKIDVSKVIIY